MSRIFIDEPDIYLEKAKEIFKTDNPTKEQRDAVKLELFPMFYGASRINTKNLKSIFIGTPTKEVELSTKVPTYEETEKFLLSRVDIEKVKENFDERKEKGIIKDYKIGEFNSETNMLDVYVKLNIPVKKFNMNIVISNVDLDLKEE